MEELAFVRQAELAFVRHPRGSMALLDSLAFADDEVPEQLANDSGSGSPALTHRKAASVRP